MINFLVWIVFGMLVLLSILDIKYKKVPSVILSSMIFVVLIMRPENLYFGVLAFVFAYMIRDIIGEFSGLDFGMADIKILTIMGLLIGVASEFMSMIVLFLIFQFIWTTLWRSFVSHEEEMPFIPCLLAVYIVMMSVGGVA